jgi:two-component system, chemotaxis family, protein-glutamate methylesterase/glutaminase
MVWNRRDMLWKRHDNGAPLRRVRPRATLNAERIKRNVVVIGASAGGVTALAQLFASLPPKLPAVIGVVLHRSTSPSELAAVLGRRSSLPVIEPQEDGRSLKQGLIYLAPADSHLVFEANAALIRRGPKEHSTRPAVDPLFRSAADVFGRRVIGVLLSGCGEDGVSGLISISQASGLALVQDPAEAIMPYMPMNALQFDDVGASLPLSQMALVLDALTNGRAVTVSGSPHPSRRPPAQSAKQHKPTGKS